MDARNEGIHRTGVWNQRLDIQAFSFSQEIKRGGKVPLRLFQPSLRNTPAIGPVQQGGLFAQLEASLQIGGGSSITPHLMVQHRQPQMMMRRDPLCLLFMCCSKLQ